jgi:hypothetical protein
VPNASTGVTDEERVAQDLTTVPLHQPHKPPTGYLQPPSVQTRSRMVAMDWKSSSRTATERGSGERGDEQLVGGGEDVAREQAEPAAAIIENSSASVGSISYL